MFGTYRTLLAIMVVAQHLAGFHVLGAYAVFGFYVLSGYLMTSILHNSYGYSFTGIKNYAVNRFLRIYPLYWVSIIFSVLLILWFGSGFAISYHEAMFIPDDAYGYFKNIFLFFPYVDSPRLTPPAWALTVELFFYILIGLGISKTKTRSIVWILSSLGYHICANMLDWGWDSIYFSIPAASLPFATGAFIFHYKSALLNPKSKATRNFPPAAIFILIIVNWKVGDLGGYSRGICFYINYIFCSAIVLLLSAKSMFPSMPKNLDNWIGNLSYPIYVIHYQIGMVIVAMLNNLGFSYQRPSIYVLIIALPFIILVAWLLTVCVEKPIERIRSKIRPPYVRSTG